jgi:hypothetical protein
MARVMRGISLEDWEDKTRLNEKQLQSVYEIKQTCTELPLPSSWVSNVLFYRFDGTLILIPLLYGCSTLMKSR